MVWQHLGEGSSRILGWFCNIFLLRGYCTILYAVALPRVHNEHRAIGEVLCCMCTEHSIGTQYWYSLLTHGRTISQAGATKARARGSCCPSAILEASMEVGAV